VGGSLAGLAGWYDGATLIHAGIPTVAFGPRGMESAHAVDEHVAVDDLVRCAQALAVLAVRFCGEAA
jgi:acetylornithine deacetylase/succinyl-diaminopimelate desuccinylase-like protein